MNSLANLNIFIEPALNPAAPAPKAKPVNTSGFKQEFNKQLNAPVKSLDSQSKKAASSLPPAEKEATSQQASSAQEKTGQQEVALNEGLRNFFAALTDEEASSLLDELTQWLNQLSPDELNELLASLEEGPGALLNLMPESLQNLVDGLLAKNPEGLEQLHELVASLAASGINFEQLASINYQQANANQPASLSLVQAEAATSALAKEGAAPSQQQAAAQNLAELANKEEAATSDRKGKNSINELISKLNKAGKAASKNASTASNASNTASASTFTSSLTSNLAGKEGINQLLQQASQGLSQNVNSTSQLNAARSMPLMMQAAAKANAQALANRLSIMQAQNMKVAEMRLDPPNLGRVRIQIRMTGEQASVNIVTANPQARELLEQALPRLKDMLSQEGIDLADAQVFDEQQQEQAKEDQAKEEVNQLAAAKLGTSAANLAGLEGEDAEQIYYLTEPLGLIDYYA